MKGRMDALSAQLFKTIYTRRSVRVGSCDFEVQQIIKCKKCVLEELAKNVEAIGK